MTPVQRLYSRVLFGSSFDKVEYQRLVKKLAGASFITMNEEAVRAILVEGETKVSTTVVDRVLFDLGF